MQYNDFFETIPDDFLPYIDRTGAVPLNQYQEEWQKQGFVKLDHFLPDDLIDEYCSVRERITDNMGYSTPIPYRTVPEICRICCYQPLSEIIEQIISEPAGVHLNLTGWVSSERDWHADSFLSPEHVGGYYVAAWFALADIHPESGPFEFIPGSHRPACSKMSQKKVFTEIKNLGFEMNDNWAKHSEVFLSDIIEERIVSQNWKAEKFIAKRGDVLLWHSGLIHRGSKAIQPGMERRALIAHYTGVNHKHSAAWPEATPGEHGGWLYPF